MPQTSRLFDVTIGTGSHGLPCCPHLIVGTRASGSPDVLINGRGASRAYRDIALHNCPHCAINACISGSPDVVANDLPVHRVGDAVTEYCGAGVTVTGSPNVLANEGGV